MKSSGTSDPDHARQSNADAALSEWRALLGDDAVFGKTEAAARYGPDTSTAMRDIVAALLPADVEQVRGVVDIARRHGVPLYPISTGHNWGYGSAQPAVDACVVVDLSRMNRIRDFDEELGVVTVEPGVRQRDLRAFFDARRLPFMVPVTGAGPSCSLLGNALERGYGITPYTDHFGAVTALQAVLPNGEIYRTPLTELGAAAADRAFKWGVGPYLDGLFSQGNFGIVTEITLALARRPEKILAFFFWLEEDAALEPAVVAMRDTLRQAGANLGGINIMNAHRVLSMVSPYPWDRVPSGQAIPPAVLADICRTHQVTPWLGTGSIYGSQKIALAARDVVRQTLGSVARRIVFFDETLVRRARLAVRLAPDPWRRRASVRIDRMASVLEILTGIPSEVALRLAYWKSRVEPREAEADPARDGCGLLWYSPLVTMKPERARAYVQMVKGICEEHAMEPLITLTALSERVFDSTVPLLFDRSDEKEAARAAACQRALFEAGKKEGFLPYRLSPSSMGWVIDQASPFWRTAARLQRAIDSEGIMAPGRYSLTPGFEC